jgi:hypothetical protein
MIATPSASGSPAKELLESARWSKLPARSARPRSPRSELQAALKTRGEPKR